MIDEENLRKDILLEDFAAVQAKLRALQEDLHKEALRLEGIVQYLKCGRECTIEVASGLDAYLSGPLRDLTQALRDACDEKAVLMQMLSEIGIKV